MSNLSAKISYFKSVGVRRKNKKSYPSGEQKGFTLVEVIIALFILSIVTLVMIQSVMAVLNTIKINKTKTIALAIANEEIEKIRLMNYEDIGIVGGSPDGILDAQRVNDDGFTISYDVTWVDGEDSYKQVAVSVIKDPMKEEVEVITQIYPAVSSGQSGEGGEENHPPAENLVISSDRGSGNGRKVELGWDKPDAQVEIDKYNIYRDGSYIGSSYFEKYIDRPGDNNNYTYYVTVLYTDGVESEKSNEVTTDR